MQSLCSHFLSQDSNAQVDYFEGPRMFGVARGKPSRTVTLCPLLSVAALLLLDYGTFAMPEHRWPVRDPESRLHDVLSVPDNPQLILQQLGGVPEIDWDSITDPSGTSNRSLL